MTAYPDSIPTQVLWKPSDNGEYRADAAPFFWSPSNLDLGVPPKVASGLPTTRKLTDSPRTEVCNATPNPLSRGAILSEPVPVKKPSLLALLLALIPFVAMCFSVALWDRIDPMILGVPFNLAWLVCWIMLSSLCMWAAYRAEAARDKKERGVR